MTYRDGAKVCALWEKGTVVREGRMDFDRGYVYVGEFEHDPMGRLWSDPRVLLTPHISSASDQDRHGGIVLFCENLRAWLDGRPMRNVVDWDRGY